MYVADYEKLKAKLEEIENWKDPAEVDIKQFEGVREVYEQLDPEHRKAFWARIIKNINVSVDNDLDITFI